MTHHLLYWLGTVWWSLGLACAQLLHMSKTCLLLMCSQWSGGSFAHSAVHPWLFIASSCFLISHPFMACFLWGWALFDYGLSFIQPVLLLFFAVLYFLPYHSVIPAVMSYDPSLLGFFGPTACSSLNDFVWLLGFLLHYLRAPVSYLFPLGHPWPICFPWASLALFLTLRSHEILLTPLGFLGPITLSFILGAHGLAINPLTFFACITSCLLWPILTFLH